MKLYYCETLNPRKACAAARYLGSPVDYIRIDLHRGEHKSPKFLAINPNGKVPVLEEEDGQALWEANAIICRLSDLAKGDLWPHDDRQIEVMRWLSWDAQHFTRHAGMLYFENMIKPSVGMGAPDPSVVEQQTANFRTFARVLDTHLERRDFVAANSLSVADFALGAALPYAEKAKLPLGEFPNIQRWYTHLDELPAWHQPFG
jgi:glutathione S-transferase